MLKTLTNHRDIIEVQVAERRDARDAFRAVVTEFSRTTASNITSLVGKLMTLRLANVILPHVRIFAAQLAKSRPSEIARSRAAFTARVNPTTWFM